jgi:hypothetical protein
MAYGGATVPTARSATGLAHHNDRQYTSFRFISHLLDGGIDALASAVGFAGLGAVFA